MDTRDNYPEVTLPALVLGTIVGILLTACFTYAGLLIGFTIGGSAVAAIVGFGVLRGLLGRGTIVENNINQTVASAINIATAGVIFTVPALYLMGEAFNRVAVGAACVAGAILGVLFIVPLRKQMIEIDRLRFPTGTAVAAVLRSPGAGVAKAIVLGIGVVIGIGITAATQGEVLPETVDLGKLLGMPPYVLNVWALSVMSLGAGFISGVPGLVVLAGSVLAYWFVAPLAVHYGWVEPGVLTKLSEPGGDPYVVGQEINDWIRTHINRPLGIGMLVGGALVGVALSLPSLAGAVRGLRRTRLGSGVAREELPFWAVGLGLVLGFLALVLAAWASFDEPSFQRVLLTALVGTAWMALAGVVVAQATGMTDWSPISGLALLAIVITLLLSDYQVAAAVLLGAAVCVAIGECADMMQDLRTGHLVGAVPFRQQLVELLFVGIGPIVSLLVIQMLWVTIGFGPDKTLTAPQAQAVEATVRAVEAQDIPLAKYAGGAAIGALLSLSGMPGLGVLVGLSMYLPMAYILPYGLGCLLQVASSRVLGERTTEEWGVPLAAGLMVGEPLVVLSVTLYKMVTVAVG